MFKTLLLFVIFISSRSFAGLPWKSEQSKAEDLTFKLLTIGPGDDLLSWFGHGGIIIQDTTNNVSRIYNFGIVEAEADYLLKFILGKLKYFVHDTSEIHYIEEKKESHRDILIQTLNIPIDKRLLMAKILVSQSSSGNTMINYDNYFNNCSTRLRDLINDILDGELYEKSNYFSPMTLRSHTKRYMQHLPFIEILLMYLTNDIIDKPIRKWEEMFLPDQLSQFINTFYFLDQEGKKNKLVEQSFSVYKSNRNPISHAVPIQWPYFMLIGMILGIIALLLAFLVNHNDSKILESAYGIYTIFIGLIIGIPGLFLTFVIIFSTHSITYYNENLFLANPISFLFIILGVKVIQNKFYALKWLSWNWFLHFFMLILAVSLKILPSFDQDNGLIFALLTPIYFFNTFSAWTILRNKKSIISVY